MQYIITYTYINVCVCIYTYIVTRNRTMFWSMMDRIHDGGPIDYNGVERLLLPSCHNVNALPMCLR